MANYQYNGNNGSGDDWGGWILVIVALVIFWPVGLVLLFRKLGGNGEKKAGTTTKQQPRQRQGGAGGNYNYTYQYNYNATTGAETTTQNPTAQPHAAPTPPPYRPAAAPTPPPYRPAAAPTPPPYRPAAAPTPPPVPSMKNRVTKAYGRGMWITGIVLAALGAISMGGVLNEVLYSGFFAMLPALMSIMGIFGAGLVLMYCGFSRSRRGRRYRKYLALLGRRDSVSVDSLAQAMGMPYHKVVADLQSMLDDGVLPMGYVDLQRGRLVLTADGIEDDVPEAEEKEEPTVLEEDDMLQQIKAVNDAISDPDMSRKIDRIGEITGKILDYQRNYPSKASQLRSFLNYYLPTTLKILGAYAQLEEQGIEGENISAAKTRIEGMMDKVVEGFEKQLDKLFQNAALDITSDVAVLEKMLDNDGLSGNGLTFGTM